MNTPEIRSAINEALHAIAPEADTASLDDATPIREAFDLDSMDFLNFIVAVHDVLHVDVPQSDYPKVQTMGALLRYLEQRLPRAQPA